MNARLPVRMFASYAVVIAVGAATAYGTVRLLAPPLFDHRMGSMNGGGMGMVRGGVSGSAHSALISALNTSLLVALLASCVTAGLVAAFVTRRLLRPLEAVRAATRQIAAGRYDASVPVPREPELAALATDVNALGGALADTEARRTRLLGDVAHEMRTPLTTLDGYVEGFIDNVLAPTPENLMALSDEVRRLHRLADDLSTLSRAEEGRVELHPADVDLVELTRRACDRLRPQFDDAGVKLDVRADAVTPVHVDADRIMQVLTNLLGNALLATSRDGTVVVRCGQQSADATVQIADDGVGLTPQDLERVFERFYRATGQPKRSAGSGVGLTIARGLARAHGGDLTASSAGPGRGATFTLRLPLRSSAREQQVLRPVT
jgi:signal transduction histidine kinase